MEGPSTSPSTDHSAALGRGQTSSHADSHALQAFSRDEAAFINAAFDCILPGEGLGGSGASRLGLRLSEATRHPHSGRPTRTPAPPPRTGAFYKAAIANVQVYCVQVHGSRFQELSPPHQLDVLTQLEAGASLVQGEQGRVLLSMLLCDAAEAYFDLVAERAM